MNKKKLLLLTGVIAFAVAVTGLFALNNNGLSVLVNADGNAHSVFLSGENLIDVSYPTFKLAKEGALKDRGDFVSLTCGCSGDNADIGGLWDGIVMLPEGGSFYLEFDLSHVSSIQEVYLEGFFGEDVHGETISELSYTQDYFDGRGRYRVDVANDAILVLINVTLNYTC